MSAPQAGYNMAVNNPERKLARAMSILGNQKSRTSRTVQIATEATTSLIN